MADADQKASTTEPAPSSGGEILIADRFEVNPRARLKPLDSPHAKAFAAVDRESARRTCFALVCDPKIPVRIGDADRLSLLASANLINVFGHGPVKLSAGSKPQYAFVLEQPTGKRLMKPGDPPMPEKFILQTVLPSVLTGLAAMHDKSIMHRNIRPANIFLAEGKRTAALLGECVTAPPGFDQPAAFEPLERAMADPAGRGVGTPACDFYALGVTIISLLLGTLPENDNRSTQILDRLERGSYKVFARHLHCSDAMRELLAGLLIDEPASRWSIDDLRGWLAGRRASPPAARRSRDGMRPYSFLEYDHKSPRTLAFGFSTNRDAAKLSLKKGHLASWLRRSYADPPMSAMVIQASAQPEDLASGLVLVNDEMVSAVSLALDPQGPIRFRGRSVMMDGFGPAIAHAVLGGSDENLDTIKKMLSLGLPLRAISFTRVVEGRKQQEATYRSYLSYAKDRSKDLGLERCLYDIDPSQPCLSPLVRESFPSSLHLLITALDAVPGGSDPPKGGPRDRHIAAFIASRLPLPERQRVVTLLRRAPREAPDQMDDLAVLAVVQSYCRVEKLPGLARWLGASLEVAVKTYCSRTQRQRVRKALEDAVRAGRLMAMFSAISDKREQIEDRRRFRAASARFSALRQELARTKDLAQRRNEIAQVRGRRIASSLAIIVLLVACAAAFGGVSI